MASKVLSIEIGYSLTKVVEIDYKVKNPKVYQSFVMETPSDLFQDDIITDHPKFSEAIRNRIADLGIRTKNAVFTLSSSKIASREVPIPANIKKNRIQNLVSLNAKDYFPIDLTNYKLTYTILQEAVDQGIDSKMNLLVLAAPRKLLDSYVRFGRTCGLDTIALDYSGNSLYQAVKPQCAEGETKMFVKVDEKNTYCMVVKGKDIVFTRNLTYGVDDAIETIIDDKAFDGINTYIDAIDLTRHKTCIYSSLNATENEREGASDPQVMRAAKKKVTESLQYLTGGIARMLDFYKSKYADSPINMINLTGIGADFSGLQKLIASETGIECKVLTQLEIRLLAKELPLGEYVACIGAAVEPVSFLEEEEEKGTKAAADTGKKDYTAAAILFFLLCIVGSAALLLMAYMPYKQAKEDKVTYTRQINQYQPAYAVFEQYLQKKYTFDKMSYYSEYADSNNDHIVEFIEEMEEKMPSNLVVQSFVSSEEGVTMSVTVNSKEEAAKLISQFRTFVSVGNVEVNSITIETNELGEDICSFSVSITYSGLHNGDIVEEETAETEAE